VGGVSSGKFGFKTAELKGKVNGLRGAVNSGGGGEGGSAVRWKKMSLEGAGMGSVGM